MSSAQKFVDALQKGGSRGAARSVEDFWRRYRDRWLQDLGQLRDQVGVWLAPVLKTDMARAVRSDFSTTEPDLGTYLAPGLKIELLSSPPRTVLLRPRGGRVVGLVETPGRPTVGAAGRVDLEQGASREPLLRFLEDGERTTRWLSFAGGEERELNEDLFFELLARCAGIRLDG